MSTFEVNRDKPKKFDSLPVNNAASVKSSESKPTSLKYTGNEVCNIYLIEAFY